MLIGKEIEGHGEAAAVTQFLEQVLTLIFLEVFCLVLLYEENYIVREVKQDILMFRAGLCLSFQLIPVISSFLSCAPRAGLGALVLSW